MKNMNLFVASQDRMTENITGRLVPIKDRLDRLTTLVNRPTLSAVRPRNKRAAEPAEPVNSKVGDQFDPLASSC